MNFLTLSTLVHHKETAIGFLQTYGVIHQQRLYNNAHQLTLSTVSGRWKCNTRQCRLEIGLRRGTWLEWSRMEFMTVILFIYLCQYEVTVVTGQLWNSGTTGRVHIQLHGDRGDSGTRLLWSTEAENGTAFLRGKTSVFRLEAVHLGRLSRLSLWLEGGTKSWYLEEIFVQELNGTALDSLATPLECEALPKREALLLKHRRITSFSCHQWLDAQKGCEPTTIQLIASELHFNESSQLHEDEWWEAEQWKFCPGTELIFYSQLTGEPLRVRTGNRVVAEQIQDHDAATSTCLVFQVEPGDSNSSTKLLLKPRPVCAKGGQFLASLELQKDIGRFNEGIDRSTRVRSFSLLSAPNNVLSLDETSGMCLHDKSASVDSHTQPTHDFRIRGRSDRYVVLESVKVSSAGAKYHAYVGPRGHVISAACGPLSMPGKLLMPYVKGTLRNCNIVWLNTSLKQTLGPCLLEKTIAIGLGNSRLWSFDVSATEQRSPESYWRVVKVTRGQRQFEAVAWPGHYLRVFKDEVDIMGNCESPESIFSVTRVRQKGFVRLSPANNVNQLVGIQDDGQLTVYLVNKDSAYIGDDVEERTRFFAEVVMAGAPSQSHQPTAANCAVQEDNCQVPTQQNVSKVTTETESRPFLKSRRQQTGMSTGKEYTEPEKTDGGKSCDESSLDEAYLPRSPAPSMDQPDSGDNWKLTLLTDKTAKNCEVILVVYGHNGNSGPIFIGQSDDAKQLFHENSIDTFMITLKDIGKIFKIRFEVSQIHVDKDMEWQLHEATLENEDKGACLTFAFTNRPFVRSASLCYMSHEQRAPSSSSSRPGSRHSLTGSLTDSSSSSVLTAASPPDAEAWRIGLVSYTVSIELLASPGWTGADRRRLEPHLSLVGLFGDSGRRLMPLVCPMVSKVKQAAEQVMVLRASIECIYLGDLSLCLFGPVDVTCGSDRTRSGPMCTRILVQDPIARMSYCFPARVWLLSERKQSVHEVHLSVAEVIRDASTLSSDGENTEDSSLLQDEISRMLAAIIEKAQKNLTTIKDWNV